MNENQYGIKHLCTMKQYTRICNNVTSRQMQSKNHNIVGGFLFLNFFSVKISESARLLRKWLIFGSGSASMFPSSLSSRLRQRSILLLQLNAQIQYRLAARSNPRSKTYLSIKQSSRASCSSSVQFLCFRTKPNINKRKGIDVKKHEK